MTYELVLSTDSVHTIYAIFYLCIWKQSHHAAYSQRYISDDRESQNSYISFGSDDNAVTGYEINVNHTYSPTVKVNIQYLE